MSKAGQYIHEFLLECLRSLILKNKFRLKITTQFNEFDQNNYVRNVEFGERDKRHSDDSLSTAVNFILLYVLPFWIHICLILTTI